MNTYLRLCTNPLCDRAVKSDAYGKRQTEFCCAPCATAAEHKHEIHAHSDGCDVRWKTRQHMEIHYLR